MAKFCINQCGIPIIILHFQETRQTSCVYLLRILAAMTLKLTEGYWAPVILI